MSRHRLRPPEDVPCSCGCGKILEQGNVKLCYRCEMKQKKSELSNSPTGPLGWVTVACRGASMFCSYCRAEEEGEVTPPRPIAGLASRVQAVDDDNDIPTPPPRMTRISIPPRAYAQEDDTDIPTPPRQQVPSFCDDAQAQAIEKVLSQSYDNKAVELVHSPRPSHVTQAGGSNNDMEAILLPAPLPLNAPSNHQQQPNNAQAFLPHPGSASQHLNHEYAAAQPTITAEEVEGRSERRFPGEQQEIQGNNAMRREWISKHGDSRINRIKLCACENDSCKKYCIAGVDTKQCSNSAAYSCSSLLSIDCDSNICKTCSVLSSASTSLADSTPTALMNEQSTSMLGSSTASDNRSAAKNEMPSLFADSSVKSSDDNASSSVEWVDKYREVSKPLSREEIVSANLKRSRNTKRNIGEDLLNGESLPKRSNLTASEEINSSVADNNMAIEAVGDEANPAEELTLDEGGRPNTAPFLSWSDVFIGDAAAMAADDDTQDPIVSWVEDANVSTIKVDFSNNETRYYRLHYFSTSIPSAPSKRFFYHDLKPKFPTPFIFNWWPADAASHATRSADSAKMPQLYLARCMIRHPMLLNGSVVCVRVMQSTCDTPIIGLVLCNLRLLQSNLLSEAFKIVRENNPGHSRLMRGIQMAPGESYDEELVEESYVTWLKQTRRFYDPRRGVSLGASESVWSKDDATLRELQQPDMEGKIKSYFFNYEKGEIDKHINLYFRTQSDDINGVVNIYPEIVEDAQGRQFVVLKRSYRIEQESDKTQHRPLSDTTEAIDTATGTMVVAPRKSLRSKPVVASVGGGTQQINDTSQAQSTGAPTIGIAEMQKQLQIQQKQKEEVVKLNKQLEKALKTTTTQLTSAKNRVDQLEAQLQSAKDVNASQKHDVQRLRKEVQDLEKKTVSLESKNRALTSQIEDSTPICSRLVQSSTSDGSHDRSSRGGGRGRRGSSQAGRVAGRAGRSSRGRSYSAVRRYDVDPDFDGVGDADEVDEGGHFQRLVVVNEAGQPTPSKVAATNVPNEVLTGKTAPPNNVDSTLNKDGSYASSAAAVAASNSNMPRAVGGNNDKAEQHMADLSSNNHANFICYPNIDRTYNNQIYNGNGQHYHHAQNNFPNYNHHHQQQQSFNCPTFNNNNNNSNNGMTFGTPTTSFINTAIMTAPNNNLGAGPSAAFNGINNSFPINCNPNNFPPSYGFMPNGGSMGGSPAFMNMNSNATNSNNGMMIMGSNGMMFTTNNPMGGFNMMNNNQNVMGNFSNFSNNGNGGMAWNRP